MQSWLHSLLAAALGREGPAPHLGTTTELTLLMEAWVSQRELPSLPRLPPGADGKTGPQVMRVGEQALLPHMGSTVELILGLEEEDMVALRV